MLGGQRSSLVAVERVQKTTAKRLPTKGLQNTAATFVSSSNRGGIMEVRSQGSKTKKGAIRVRELAFLKMCTSRAETLLHCSPNVWGTVGSCGAGVDDKGDAVDCIGASIYKQHSGNGCAAVQTKEIRGSLYTREHNEERSKKM
jgi:hypothetical protein